MGKETIIPSQQAVIVALAPVTEKQGYIGSNSDSRTETEILYSIIQTGTDIYTRHIHILYIQKETEIHRQRYLDREKEIYIIIYIHS